jgi:hypothetical protein
MLTQATASNFRTDPENLRSPDGSRAFADKLTLDSGLEICKEVKESAGKLHSAKLRQLVSEGIVNVAPLLVSTGSDATTRPSTTEASWDALTLVLGNLLAESMHRRDATGLLALMPIFKNPHCSVRDRGPYLRYKERAHIAQHMALDCIYESVRSLHKGLLWELFPSYMVHFLPRIYGRSGDFPKQQLDLGQMGSASSRSPCRLCCLPGCLHMRLARVWETKPVFPWQVPAQQPELCISGAAAVGLRDSPALRKSAQAVGSALMGRTPAPLTPRALSVSSKSPDDARGHIGTLHCLGGLHTVLVKMLTSHAGGPPLLDADGASLLRERIAGRLP